MRLKTTMFAFATAFALSTASVAVAAEAVLYEVSETVKLNWGSGKFRSSDAVLTGVVQSGTELCPTWIVGENQRCWITVRARGQASDATGIGPVDGLLQITVEGRGRLTRNPNDAGENLVIEGKFKGTLDLSGPFLRSLPLGYVTGEYEIKGIDQSVADDFRAKGRFTGTFRLPFRYGDKDVYMLDNGSMTQVKAAEYSIGTPTVKLEVNFEPIR